MLESVLVSVLVAFPNTISCSLLKWGGDANKVQILCTASHHVAESCVALVPGSRVLACAAGMVMVDVTTMGPTVVGVVVESSGPGWFRSGLVIAAILGAWG